MEYGWILTWGKELHVVDQVIHLLCRLLATLFFPSEIVSVNMILLNGIGAFHNAFDRLPPFFLGAIVLDARIGAVIDEFSQRRISEGRSACFVWFQKLVI